MNHWATRLITLTVLMAWMTVAMGCSKRTSEQERLAQAQQSLAIEKIKALKVAVEKYRACMGHCPSEEEGGLRALLEVPADAQAAAAWKKGGGPFVAKEWLVDPWNREFQYEVMQQQDKVVPHIWSEGPDGVIGTHDDIGV